MHIIKKLIEQMDTRNNKYKKMSVPDADYVLKPRAYREQADRPYEDVLDKNEEMLFENVLDLFKNAKQDIMECILRDLDIALKTKTPDHCQKSHDTEDQNGNVKFSKIIH